MEGRFNHSTLFAKKAESVCVCVCVCVCVVEGTLVLAAGCH